MAKIEMIKCTGARCPIQYNSKEKFDPSKCRITDICDCATPITDKNLNILLSMLIYIIQNREES